MGQLINFFVWQYGQPQEDGNDPQLYAFNTQLHGGFTIATRVIESTVRMASIKQWYGSTPWTTMTLYGVCQSFLPGDATYISGGKGQYLYGTSVVAGTSRVLLTIETNGCTIG